MGVRGGDKVEWTELSHYSQINNEIWVDILIGNYDRLKIY